MSFRYREEKEQSVSRKPEFHVSSDQDILEEIKKIWLEIRNMREDFNRESTRIWEEIRSLREEATKIWEEIRGIRRTLEDVTITIEEEAREVI